MATEYYVGTSGWSYRHWKDDWYKGVPQKRWLEFCSERFTSLEIDGTFYGSKPKSVFEKWAAETPKGFRFAVRGHRFVTHYRRLKDVKESLQRVREPAEGLGEKLGPVLWQTPPNMGLDLDRLKSFVEDLQVWNTAQHALEFRNEDWFVPEVKAVLEDAKVAVCISDGAGIPRWQETTADWTYVRLHGRPYQYWSEYTEEQIDDWATRIRSWSKEAAYVYFDNDAAGKAPRDALCMIERLR